MSLRAFDVPTMIAISAPWVDDTQDRKALSAYPLTAGLVPHLESAHRLLLSLEIAPEEERARIAELSESAARLDAEHNDKYRAVYSMLGSLAAMSEPGRRRLLGHIRDELFPEGLAMTRRSRLARSGNVELAVSAITPDIATILSGISMNDQTLLEAVYEWVSIARRLGDVERERVRLEGLYSRAIPDDARISRAEDRWIRTVRALIGLLDVPSDIPEDIKSRILQPIKEAEFKLATEAKATGNEPDFSEFALDPKDETAAPLVSKSAR